MLPKTMQFAANAAGGFESRANPKEPGTMVQVASNTELGQQLGFKISGTGTLNEGRDDSDGGGHSAETAPLDAIPVPAEDWGRQSTLPIRWKNIAGTFWEALP